MRRSIAKPLCVCLFIALLFGASASNARAAEAAASIIVFDASGSMEGEIGADRRKKHEIGREALRAALANTPGVRLGLVGFGHRRRGCGDIELIVPPDAGSAGRTLQLLDAVKPNRGKGPLVQAVREAHKSLATLDGAQPRSIVVVHDGADNCGQDACAAAAEFVKAGPLIPIYLVSLGLERADVAKVSCLARLTGGQMFDVADAASAVTAAKEAVKLAALDSSTPPPAPETAGPEGPAVSPADNEGPPRLKLTASLSEQGPAIAAPLHWKIYKVGAESAQPLLDRVAVSITESMESGKYIVEAHHGLALARGPLEVAAKGLTSVHVPLNAGFIKVSAKSARTGEPLSGALLTVARKEAADDQGQAVQEPIWVGSGDAEIIVPAGMYDVQLAHGLIKAKQTVTLAAGGRAVSEFTPAMGQLELSASLVEGGPPVPDATFILAEDDPDSPQGRREIARTAHPQPVFAIAAGTYYVTARVGETEVRQRIAVGPGDVVRRSLALGVSRIEVLAALDTGALADGTQLLHRVLTLDGEPREVARSTATPATFSLAAGRYRIESIYGSENVRAATDIDVVAGKDSQIAQHLAAARVTIEPTGGASAPGAALGAWEVRDAKGGVIWRCQRPETKTTLLAPGRYLARIEVADKWLEKSFDLKAGEQRKVDPAQP